MISFMPTLITEELREEPHLVRSQREMLSELRILLGIFRPQSMMGMLFSTCT